MILLTPQDASFHVSVLWCLGDKKKALDELKSEMQLILDQKLVESVIDFQIDVKRFHCKIGNKLFTIGRS